jgi:anti-anti-sigma factor
MIVIDILKIERICDISPQVKAIERYATASVVKFTGEIGLEEITSIVRVLGIYRDHLRQDIVLDLGEVTRIDAATLTMLVHIMDRIKQKQKDLSMANCNVLIREYVKIGKLESVVHIYRTAEAALNRVSERSV